jgi:hypothetical protein
MAFKIIKAVRRALPLQIGFYGPQGSGKTMSALLMAAGLAKGGKVCIIDSERGRASLYSDNKRVMAALPQGYDVLDLDAPYHPDRYREAIDTVEQAGYSVCLIDSESDSWDGSGGCADITVANKGRWNKAKLANKKMKTRIALSNMHFIELFKAQEKSKIISKQESASGQEEVLSLGMLPVCERNAFYPLLLGFSVDPKTHLSTAVKYHDDLGYLFKEPKLITKADGEAIIRWNETGTAVDPLERLRERAGEAASDGIERYSAFFSALSKAEKRHLQETTHEANKQEAARVDEARKSDELSDAAEPPLADPEPSKPSQIVKDINAYRAKLGDEAWWRVLGANGYEKPEDVPAGKFMDLVREFEDALPKGTS